VITSISPSGTPTQAGLSSKNVTVNTDAVMPKSSEPPSPSHDFFGLIAGAIRCLPNNTPAT
jgi:hypothetical protein